MLVGDAEFERLTYTELRKVAVEVGALVQDDPDVDLLKQRIRQCCV